MRSFHYTHSQWPRVSRELSARDSIVSITDPPCRRPKITWSAVASLLVFGVVRSYCVSHSPRCSLCISSLTRRSQALCVSRGFLSLSSIQLSQFKCGILSSSCMPSLHLKSWEKQRPSHFSMYPISSLLSLCPKHKNCILSSYIWIKIPETWTFIDTWWNLNSSWSIELPIELQLFEKRSF